MLDKNHLKINHNPGSCVLEKHSIIERAFRQFCFCSLRYANCSFSTTSLNPNTFLTAP